MPQIYVCFLWHMHQPFYKDLVSGEYKMPWTRLHALKDYAGMVEVLEEFPEVHQTFNLVPSLMMQVEEYARGEAADPYLKAAFKPAETLSDTERESVLHNFLPANPPRIYTQFPRYVELRRAWEAAGRDPRRAARLFSTQALRDLQVLAELAWFDQGALECDPEVRALVAKGRNFTPADQQLVARKERELLAKVLPVYKRFAARGQIEISTTPLYHPILPLLCDSNIAGVSHPHVPLPPRFRYPQDARYQLHKAREYTAERLGAAPVGLWPSEGSVSDEVLSLAAHAGFRWAATDNGVLSRTLNRPAGVEETYRPYLWRQDSREIALVFRDHYLSDLIGFVYSRMGAVEAAHDFIGRIRDNCSGILASGRDAFVPIILDGENAWEFYDRNGRPFLRELYRGITQDRGITALTMSEALKRVEPQVLDHIFPGSWISANFDVWIGAEEDNRAWEYLLRARQTFDRAAAGVPEEDRKLAYEELLISEGSDWCWWYGPEHQSDYRGEFDSLYRSHLANVYRALHLAPPDELSRPILKTGVAEMHTPPASSIRPVIDGKVTSYFEWLGAGVYRVDKRSGSMHGKQFLIQELLYGSDGQNLYLRLDFEPAGIAELSGTEARLRVEAAGSEPAASTVSIEFRDGRAAALDASLARTENGAAPEFEFRKVLEMRLPLAALAVAPGDSLRLQLSLWKRGLPVDALPGEGWLVISTAEPTDWPI